MVSTLTDLLSPTIPVEDWHTNDVLFAHGYNYSHDAHLVKFAGDA